MSQTTYKFVNFLETEAGPLEDICVRDCSAVLYKRQTVADVVVSGNWKITSTRLSGNNLLKLFTGVLSSGKKY